MFILFLGAPGTVGYHSIFQLGRLDSVCSMVKCHLYRPKSTWEETLATKADAC